MDAQAKCAALLSGKAPNYAAAYRVLATNAVKAAILKTCDAYVVSYENHGAMCLKLIIRTCIQTYEQALNSLAIPV